MVSLLVLNVSPWDGTEPLEIHDSTIMTKSLLPVEQSNIFVIGSLRGIAVVWVVDGENDSTASAALSMLSRRRMTVSIASTSVGAFGYKLVITSDSA